MACGETGNCASAPTPPTLIERWRVKIVVALDKFKGSLAAPRACEIVRDALLSSHPDWRLVIKPMADGGEGTDETLLAELGGEWISRSVMGWLKYKRFRGANRLGYNAS